MRTSARRALLALTGWSVLGGGPALADPSTVDYLHLRLGGQHVRWKRAASHGDTVLTYRIARGEHSYADAVNCGRITSVTALAQSSGIDEAAFRQELRAAFDMWQRVARIDFHEVPDGASADIVIGAQVEPQGRAFAQVFHDPGDPSETKPITSALICLNPTTPWKIGFDGNLSVYDLRFTMAHEIGHAIGLDHPDGHGQLMGYRYDERISDLRSGDIRGVVTLYGARRPADTAAIGR